MRQRRLPKGALQAGPPTVPRAFGASAAKTASGGVRYYVWVIFEGQDEGDLGVAQGLIAAGGGSPVRGDAEPEPGSEPDRRAVLGADPGVHLRGAFDGGEGGCRFNEPPGHTDGASRRVDPQTEQLH